MRIRTKYIIHLSVFILLIAVDITLVTLFPICRGGIILFPALYIVGVIGWKTHREFKNLLNTIDDDIETDPYIIELEQMGILEVENCTKIEAEYVQM